MRFVAGDEDEYRSPNYLAKLLGQEELDRLKELKPIYDAVIEGMENEEAG